MQNEILLNISTSNRIQDLQDAFNTVYPFLKIEFSRRHSANRPGSAYLHGSLPLTAAGLSQSGTTAINDSMTVDQFEKNLKNNFGLDGHILRKSGTTWLETSMTGAWSLKQQNQHGKELSA